MAWTVRFHDDFDAEFADLPVAVQDEMLARAKVLSQVGPTLGRPLVDKLAGSKHSNMKEMRFDAGGGVWRVAFAFDPAREAILLVAGDKGGVGQGRFYKGLVERADKRFDSHLAALKDKR